MQASPFWQGLGLRPAVTSSALLGVPWGAWSWVGADEMSSAHPPRGVRVPFCCGLNF